jgi:Tol biopolymer transport system component
LSDLGRNATASSWSADGVRIVFSKSQGDTARVFSVGLDHQRPAEIGRVRGRAPVLMPDQHHLLYSAGAFPLVRLMISGLGGENAKTLTDSGSGAFNPAASPDGQWIAYSRLDSAKRIAVWVMKQDASEGRQVSHFEGTSGLAQWPVWSPNARSLAVQVSLAGAPGTTRAASQIWIIDLTTESAHPVGSQSERYLDETPSWFPDGRRIAFQSDRTGRMEVWVMNADRTDARQLTK